MFCSFWGAPFVSVVAGIDRAHHQHPGWNRFNLSFGPFCVYTAPLWLAVQHFYAFLGKMSHPAAGTPIDAALRAALAARLTACTVRGRLPEHRGLLQTAQGVANGAVRRFLVFPRLAAAHAVRRGTPFSTA